MWALRRYPVGMQVFEETRKGGFLYVDKTSYADAPTEQSASPMPLLYQAGHLTIKSQNPRTGSYTLAIPNSEVAEGLFELLLPAYANTTKTNADRPLDAFEFSVINEDIDRALHHLRAFFAGIPYDMAPKCEKDFQTVLWQAFKLAGFVIDSEVCTATERIDLVLMVGDTTHVIKLKYDGSSEAALEQINAKGCLVPFGALAQGEPLVKVGANFSSKERTIEGGGSSAPSPHRNQEAYCNSTARLRPKRSRSSSPKAAGPLVRPPARRTFFSSCLMKSCMSMVSLR